MKKKLKNVKKAEGVVAVKMVKKQCCDILGKKLNPDIKWFKSKKANGDEWIPAFLQYVDKNKCTGCGMCVKVCLGNCYELQGKIVNGKKKKVSVAVRPEKCFGDCHCHKTCPVLGGAMICKPKLIQKTK